MDMFHSGIFILPVVQGILDVLCARVSSEFLQSPNYPALSEL
jgi:hypothetical protein